MNRIVATNFIKTGLYTGFVFGGFCGLFPNDVSIKYNNINYNLPKPIIGAIVGSTIALTSPIIFPFLFVNYFSKNAYFDKKYDEMMLKYNIKINRYHQYDGTGNEYAYPSIIHIEITENIYLKNN